MASTAIFSVRAGFQVLCTSSPATPVDGINQNLSFENVEGSYPMGISPTVREFEISAIPVKEGWLQTRVELFNDLGLKRKDSDIQKRLLSTIDLVGPHYCNTRKEESRS